jgi:hypothetical protein
MPAANSSASSPLLTSFRLSKLLHGENKSLGPWGLAALQ